MGRHWIWWLRLTVIVGWILWWLGLTVYTGMISPFNPKVQRKVFNKVASLMHYEINPILLPPRILKGSEVTTEYNNSVWGFDVGDKRSNIFDYKNNVIILRDDAKIHSLAHEYVHYFQYQYGLQDFDEGLTDRQEMEAVQIQNNFR